MSSRLLAFGLAWICALTAVAGASQGGPAPVGSRLYLPCGNGTPYPAPDFGEDNQPSLAQLSAVGDVVARVETVLGQQDTFLLRATLPVPPATLRRGATDAPFAVRGADGVVKPTQVTIVSLRARDTDGADVVEVAALVDRPPGASVGSRVQYDVVRTAGSAGAFVGAPVSTALVATTGTVRLRTRDLHGNLYEADLLADIRAQSGTSRTLSSGLLYRRDSEHAVLMPVAPQGGAAATLPHAMGVQAFVTRYAHTNALRLDLHVHNAFTGRDANDPSDDVLGDLVFDQLELLLPSGWAAVASVADPFLGTGVDDGAQYLLPLVRNQGQDALHVLPQLRRFQRRVVIAPVAELEVARALAAEEGLAFVVPEPISAGARRFSWWNKLTARYWPQKTALPLWDDATVASQRSALASTYSTIAAIVETGGTSATGYPVSSGVLGWAHPWGPTTGSMTGGDEIWLWDGADIASARSLEGLRLAQLRMRMYTSRQPNVLFERDGAPMTLDGCTLQGTNGPYMPIAWFNGPLLSSGDPLGLASADSTQYTLAGAQARLPIYNQYIRSYKPVDYQHYVRHVRTLKTLVWLANDPLARFELEAQAEAWRMAYPHVPLNQQGVAVVTSFLADRRHVDAHPGQGLDFGRGEGWGLDTLVAWYAVAPPERRSVLQRDFARIVELLWDAHSACSGTLMAAPSMSAFGGLYRVRAQNEVSIIEHALVGLRQTALVGQDPCASAKVAEILKQSYYGTISPLVWRSARNGPVFKLAVGPFDSSQPLYCTTVPPGGESPEVEWVQCPSSFAHAWLATQDPQFLARACELSGVTSLQQIWQSPVSNWQNRLALLRLAQDL